MPLETIRQLLIAGNLEAALQQLDELAPGSLRDDVQLLWSQFNDWRREDTISPGARPETLNRIRYALLAIISELEKNTTTGPARQKARALHELETGLAKGYAALAQIRKKTVIDKFLLWAQENHGAEFREIIREEAAFGRAPNLAAYFQKMDFAAFIRQNRLDSRPEDAVRYFLVKNAEAPGFFSGWLEYRVRQARFETAFELEIDRTEKQHRGLLAAGLLGGVAGSLAVGVFQNKLGTVAENYTGGEQDPWHHDGDHHDGDHHHGGHDGDGGDDD